MAAALSPPTRWDYLRRAPGPLSAAAASPASSAGENETYRPRSAHQPTTSRQVFVSRLPTQDSPLEPMGSTQYFESSSPEDEEQQDPRPFTADPGTAQAHRYSRSITSPAFEPKAYGAAWTPDDLSREEMTQRTKAQNSAAYPPSKLAQYGTRRTPSHGVVNGTPHYRPQSGHSQRSGHSVEDREGASGGRNKLSAQSWVMGGSEMDHGTTTNGSRSLRRKNSNEALRPVKLRLDVPSQGAEQGSSSRGDRVITKAPSPSSVPSPRTRLFLTDSGPVADVRMPTMPPVVVDDVSQDIPVEPKTLLVEARSDELLMPRPRDTGSTPSPSSKRSSIVDSIPTRTSSLRQSSISPNPEKKKKSKSKSSRQISSVFSSSKKAIPDSKWEGLGEDDETVKRILQLRERRQSRMLESHRSLSRSPGPAQPINEEEISAPDDRVVDAIPQFEADQLLVPLAVSPKPSREYIAVPNGMVTPNRRVGSLSGANRSYASLDERVAPSAQLDTTGPANGSPAPSPSLGYAYHEAIASLQTPSRSTTMKANSATASVSNFSRPSESNRPSLDTRSVDSTPQRSRSKSFRWTSGRQDSLRQPARPEVRSSLDKKVNRRQSVSNGGPTRVYGDLATVPNSSDVLPRRDSTEVAVDEYLHSPRFARKVQHPQSGRIITFSEVGDPDGAAVFMCIGMGLTRFISGFFDELAHTLRLRLITIDRPGVGASQPYPPHDKTGPLGWPDDVLTICNKLNISKFSMLAHSAGAVYALATALRLPDMVVGKIHLLAPWIPLSQLEAFSRSNSSAVPAGALPRSQRILRALPTPLLRAANASFMSSTSASIKPESRRGSTAIRSESPRLYEERERTNQNRPPSRTNDPTPLAHQRRESLLHMDQYKPADMGGANSFPAPVASEASDAASVRSSVHPGTRVSPGSLALASSKNSISDNNGNGIGNNGSLAFTAPGPSAAPSTADWAAFQRRQRYSRRLTQRTWDLATKDSNPAADLLVCLERQRSVGFRYIDVQRDVVITHGSEDRRVPIGNVRWLSEQMNRRGNVGRSSRGDSSAAPVRAPMTRSRGGSESSGSASSCELRVLAGEGHGLMASPRVMGDVLTEIAGYWYPQLNGPS